MMNTQKRRLTIAVAGAVSLGASIAQAADFNASTTLQNTLAVTVVNDLDIGTIFATKTGVLPANGVGAVVISPAGTATNMTADSTSVNLTSLTAPTPAQGSVEMAGDFFLTLPDTSAIAATDFPINAGSNIGNITLGTGTSSSTELVHESLNPAVPSLYLMHFTVSDESGGVASEINASTNDGLYRVVQDFGVTTYVFNIGATLTTKPTTGEETYQEGIYSGTFEVIAAY